MPESPFVSCGTSGGVARSCGPGVACNGDGSCVVGQGCQDLDCDDAGRCWARTCTCARPSPPCTPAPLDKLNAPDFVGSPLNGRDTEGAFSLGFDDVCTAYAVTMISGPDYLRQMAPDGTLTVWPSTTNLNMGEVAVLRVPTGEFSSKVGEIAATYICCATCGCEETGNDGRLGVVRLDRASASRPLPNVLAATPTTGAGPFGSTGLDTGPYGLTWGADHALYIGNIRANGDYSRIDLAAGTSAQVATFPGRVVAATTFDLQTLLVAVEGGQVYLFDLRTRAISPWATLAADPTSLARDAFTGRVYAELHTGPPTVVEVSPGGTNAHLFQTPPRLGRIAIAPDGYLYHLSVPFASNWSSHDTIVRWALPTQR